MLHRNFVVGLAVPRRSLVAAALASLVGHAALAATLVWTAGTHANRDPVMVVDVDLDIAPAAPEGFEPLAGRPATLVAEPQEPDEPDEAAAPAPEPGPTLEPAIDEEKEKRERREKARRERKERERREQKEREEREERERQEALARQAGDAGPDDMAGAMDAGPAVAANPADAGAADPEAGGEAGIAQAAIATPPDPAGPHEDPAAVEEPRIPLPPGASADLRAYAPEGDKIAVLLRYDRLRGTPWAALADAIIAPMPDYRSIIGNRKVALADLFQSLLISSRNPTNVTATNLVARTHLGGPEVRRFLDHALQRVTWQPVRGGMLGRRESSELKLERDRRVYLMPLPGLVVLTATKHLGVLIEPVPGRADAARAAEVDLPAWLDRARSVEQEAGSDSDVIAVVTVGGLRATELDLPQLGVLPTPERFSLAVEMARVGFYVRGTLQFSTAELAEKFETALKSGRERLLASRFSQLMLQNLHALHAIQGLALRRRGPLVTYATSISNADTKAGMKLAAEWARRFFETGSLVAPSGAPSGVSPGVPPGKSSAGHPPDGRAGPPGTHLRLFD